MYKNFPDHYIYPAVIEHCEDNYCLYYPDLPGCASSGDTVEKAVELGKAAAQEYLWELEHDGEDIRAKMDNRTVKKTLTIPWYLNELAEARHINFSHTLRQALQTQLGV